MSPIVTSRVAVRASLRTVLDDLTLDEVVGQDELLVCDPADPDHPRVERLLGERADEIEFVPLDSGSLSGAERGRWAAERARSYARATTSSGSCEPSR